MFTSVCVNMESCEYIRIYKTLCADKVHFIHTIDLYIYLTYGIFFWGGGGLHTVTYYYV